MLNLNQDAEKFNKGKRPEVMSVSLCLQNEYYVFFRF